MLDLHEESIKNRQIYLWGEVNDELALHTIQEMNYLAGLSNEPICLIINSGGGAADCEAVIVDEILALQKAGIIISTIAVGIACSAAATILALGTKKYRFARPHSTIMLHPASISIEDDYEHYQKSLLDFMMKQNDRINVLVAKACGMSRKYKRFLKDIDKGLWLTSEEAVKYGVIDGIWIAPLPSGG